MSEFICKLCGNSDPAFIGIKPNGEKYCRKCISFIGEKAEPIKRKTGITVLKLDYSLSKEQEEISKKVISNYQSGINTLINAVCGAGKTELVYGVMAYALSQGGNVGFAVPRRDVVNELFFRIKSAFPSNSITKVLGGETSILTKDIIVLTTHQLYRYENYFDLLILDEIDAFPFKDNSLLISMFNRAVKGRSVIMSATPSKEIVELYSKGNREILELNTRFHRKPLPVPKLVISPFFLKYFLLIRYLRKFILENKQTFIFAPTISECVDIYNFIKIFIKNGSFVHSKCKDREQRIQEFKDKKTKFLVTTAVLERGVTVKNLQVIIFNAHHTLYDSYSLIQISGRVGRKYDAPKGEVIFLADKETTAIKECIETIRRKNESL